jgi:hypothetical protein
MPQKAPPILNDRKFIERLREANRPAPRPQTDPARDRAVSEARRLVANLAESRRKT